MNVQPPPTALVTGASSGLGAEFARQLAARAYKVVLVARREERLAKLAAGLQTNHGITADIVVADLSNETGIEKVVNSISQIPNLTVLVNNAGFGLSGRFAQLAIDRQIEMIHLHVIASVRLTYAALPGMLERKSGAIINVSSLAGILPLRNVTYGSTKAYLIHFSRLLQNELEGTGIRIQALCPGYILTEFHATRDVSKKRRSQIPKFLWLSPEKVVSESLASIDHGKVVYIPGRIYRLITILGTNAITFPIISSLLRKIYQRKVE